MPTGLGSFMRNGEISPAQVHQVASSWRLMLIGADTVPSLLVARSSGVAWTTISDRCFNCTGQREGAPSLATMLLGDNGADVIKVGRTVRAGTSGAWVTSVQA